MNLPARRRVMVALLPREVADLGRHCELTEDSINGVVIDTLRFTTTACQALYVGANSVQVASTVEEAQNQAARLPSRPLLCGERHCHRIAGFDLGNSPLEYLPAVVKNRDLLFTTTNGTLAVDAVRHFPRVLLAALVNRDSVCRLLIERTTGDVVIVCAGTDGQLTWEDVLTAGAVIDRLIACAAFRYGHDTARLTHSAWQSLAAVATTANSWPAILYSELEHALGGKNLVDAGYLQDLRFAAQLDSIAAVPHCETTHSNIFTLMKLE